MAEALNVLGYGPYHHNFNVMKEERDDPCMVRNLCSEFVIRSAESSEKNNDNFKVFTC